MLLFQDSHFYILFLDGYIYPVKRTPQRTVMYPNRCTIWSPITTTKFLSSLIIFCVHEYRMLTKEYILLWKAWKFPRTCGTCSKSHNGANEFEFNQKSPMYGFNSCDTRLIKFKHCGIYSTLMLLQMLFQARLISDTLFFLIVT